MDYIRIPNQVGFIGTNIIEPAPRSREYVEHTKTRRDTSRNGIPNLEDGHMIHANTHEKVKPYMVRYLPRERSTEVDVDPHERS